MIVAVVKKVFVLAIVLGHHIHYSRTFVKQFRGQLEIKNFKLRQKNLSHDTASKASFLAVQDKRKTTQQHRLLEKTEEEKQRKLKLLDQSYQIGKQKLKQETVHTKEQLLIHETNNTTFQFPNPKFTSSTCFRVPQSLEETNFQCR